jgi:hypothetical protein
MSEAKTPRTESPFCIIGRLEKLVTENAELKAKVEELKRDLDRVFPERDELKAENIRITKLRDHDFEELAELAELKRQIAEGELIPFDMIRPILGAWHSKDCKSDNFLEFTKEFAKREADAK